VPKAGTPRTKRGYTNSAESFRRAQRHLTWRRPRRIRSRTKRAGGLPRPSFVAGGKELLRTPLQDLRLIDRLPSQPPASGQSSTQPGGPDPQIASAVAGAPGEEKDVPDASAEFRSELGALLAFYAARINAARRSLPAQVAAAVIQALLTEQTIALRALAQRRRAAGQKRRAEKPARPTGPAQRKDQGPKPS
jgi:hypothetical protein